MVAEVNVEVVLVQHIVLFLLLRMGWGAVGWGEGVAAYTFTVSTNH